MSHAAATLDSAGLAIEARALPVPPPGFKAPTILTTIAATRVCHPAKRMLDGTEKAMGGMF